MKDSFHWLSRLDFHIIISTPQLLVAHTTFTPTCFHNYSKNNLKLRMKCQRSVANSGVYEKEDLYGKKVPKKEKKKKSDGLLTEVFHGLGEKSLESVQTVALRVHTLKA